MLTDKKGQMFILSSPSGVGKTTLTKELTITNSNFVISISYTTRKPRSNEVNGKDYHFVSIEEFKKLIKEESFFEYALIFNNYYGTLKKTVMDLIQKGKDVLFDIDWQGTQQLKRTKNLSPVTIFVLPPNIKILKERLLNRHKGQENLIKERMNKFDEEISHWNEYNYVVVNDDLKKCCDKISNIVKSEKEGIKFKQDFDEIKKKVKELTS